MAYVVNLMDRALRDLEHYYMHVNAESSTRAARWFRELEKAIYNLEENPSRCPVTPESPRLRHLLYGKRPHTYRIIYRVEPERLLVLTVIEGHRRLPQERT